MVEAQQFYSEVYIGKEDKAKTKVRLLVYDRDKSGNGFYSQFIKFLRTEGDPIAEVQIQAKYLARHPDKAAAGRQIFGTDVYLDISDLITTLYHCGHLSKRRTPIATIGNLETAKVIVKKRSDVEVFKASLRNDVESRPYKLEEADKEMGRVGFEVLGVILYGAYTPDLTWEVPEHGDATRLTPGVGESWTPSCLPCHVTTTQEGGAAASTRGANSGERKTAIVETPYLMSSLAFDTWPAFRLSQVADASVRPKGWLDKRLDEAVLLMETASARYQLQKLPREEPQAGGTKLPPSRYTLSKVKPPYFTVDYMHVHLGFPLPSEHTTPVHDRVGWSQLRWAIEGLVVQEQGPADGESEDKGGLKQTVYKLLRVRFVPVGQVPDEEEGVKKRRRLYAPVN